MIIVLMGYMASGKSFIGKVLAKKVGYDFIDLDDYIEEQEGKTISDIFETSGEIYFRKIESTYLSQVLETKTNIVLSLGGGTPCYGNNISLIKNNPRIVSFYLSTNINTIVSRLENEKSKRPLVSRFKSKDELQEFIGKHLFERNHFYNQANYVIKNDDVLIGDIVEDIVVKLF
ncbi:shikimate kinase [Pontimicrobium sp. SW4]|uniref:Shikimate kinase n=1 Tax=Pontimicrobium sp. SW4 TaxID=3153519 RepID=A0AAU7BPS1_9FLAO